MDAGAKAPALLGTSPRRKSRQNRDPEIAMAISAKSDTAPNSVTIAACGITP
jgi:hypothetical protein